MDVFRKLVFTAVIAGLVTGGLVTLAHYFGTASIIARAEVYEKAADNTDQIAAPASVHSHAVASTAPDADHHAAARVMPDMDHASAQPEWEPKDGMERNLYTALADMVTAVAFSLLLAAALELRGGDVNWRTGLFWGLAGFAVFALAPGLGLPPEVPGTAAAPLHARQIWWASTAAATAGGLALLFLQRRPVWVLAGIVLLIAPHLYGAPQPSEYRSAAPEGLAREFVVTATITSLLFWIVLGILTGFVLNAMRLSSAKPAMARALKQGS